MIDKTKIKSPFVFIPTLIFFFISISGLVMQIKGLVKYSGKMLPTLPVRELFSGNSTIYFLFGSAFSICLLFSAIQLLRAKRNAAFGVYAYTILIIIRNAYSYLPIGGDEHLTTNEYHLASGITAVLIWGAISLYVNWLTKRKF